MRIEAQNLSKRFGFEWVFKDFNHTFDAKSCTAITGSNGSGKSTLLKSILGIEPPSAGNLQYKDQNGTLISDDRIYRNQDFVAPYSEIIEEFTTSEIIEFHTSLKSQNSIIGVADLLEETGLANHQNKAIGAFSSGMKQRLKLILAFTSSSEVLLLDEPTVNLDNQGIDWYQQTITKLIGFKTIIVASNQEAEYQFCDSIVDIRDYKPQEK